MPVTNEVAHAVPEFELSRQFELRCNMNCFEKLSYVLWHCQYHIVWVPKYRYRVLKGTIAQKVLNCIQVYSSQLGCQIVELNVQIDHVHLLVNVTPKVPISKLLGMMKGKAALRIFTRFPYLRKSPAGAITFGQKDTE